MGRVVVVLGGNAFVAPGQRLSIEGQIQFAYQSMAALAPLLNDDTELLISHGNGPQVGQILTRVEAALGKAYPLPLEVCVAESQGELGYVLQQAIHNVLMSRGVTRPSAVILSRVEVDPADEAFSHPTKPIGVFYDVDQAERLKSLGFAMAEDSGRGWRRVVPSPRPRTVLELQVVRRLLEERVIVIAAGGGGIPVARGAGVWTGVEAVIDKDLTGALLARQLNADQFIILTDVPCAYLHFRSASPQPIAHMSVNEARQWIKEGQFAPGSMLPKIEAAVEFAEHTGREAMVCNPANLHLALQGEAGTRVSPRAALSSQPTHLVAEPLDRSDIRSLDDSPHRKSAVESRLPYRSLILGAAGRDFHNFLTFFRDRPEFEVCGFTAAQIPFIEQREFPASLSGPLYERPLPIFSEERLGELIQRLAIDFVFLAYSDLSHEEVMHRASIAHAHGASFALLGPKHTQLIASKPVISVTAVRTGAGKSPISQFLAQRLREQGQRVGVLRHPMPYGDLERQRVERIASWEDLVRYQCTVEEREEYEPYVEMGIPVFAGVDYASVLMAAEQEADLILWDGGNNDFSFLRPDLSIVVVDALRPGHEHQYHPGESNARSADVLVINKVSRVSESTRSQLREELRRLNSTADIIEAELELTVTPADAIVGRRVLVVEDGPTLTHGGMAYGAGMIAAREGRAGGIVDPRPTAVGTLAQAYSQFPHLEAVVPALGYATQQLDDLARTINESDAELIIDASPCSLERLISIRQPIVRVRYRFRQLSGADLMQRVEQVVR